MILLARGRQTLSGRHHPREQLPVREGYLFAKVLGKAGERYA
jgi:hypothetical protein